MKIGKLINLLSMVFVILVSGCATSGDSTGKSGSFKRVSAANELLGKWEGSINVAIPANKKGYIPKSSIEVSVFLEYIEGDEEINSGMKVDMNRFLTDWVNVSEVKAAGLTKDQLWEMLTEEYEEDDSMIVGGKYYITSDLSGPEENFLNDTAGYFAINEGRTQLKLVFNDPIKFGMGDSGFKEIVLNRK